MASKPSFEEPDRNVEELKRGSVSRQLADDKLAVQNRLMSTLLDNLQVGVFMVEAPTGKPLLANKRALELLGRGILNSTDKDSLAEVYKAYKLGTEDYYPRDQMPIVRGMYGESRSVDDMEVVRPDGTRVLLEVFGSPVRNTQGTVVAVTNSLEALERFKAEPDAFDLVVSDLAMPHMEGDRLTQELLSIRPDIPIILCTGHGDRMDEKSVKALGANAVALKPLAMRDMAKLVRDVLDSAKK